MFIFYFFNVGIRDFVIIINSIQSSGNKYSLHRPVLFRFLPRVFLLPILLLDRCHFGSSLQYGQLKGLVYFFFFFLMYDFENSWYCFETFIFPMLTVNIAGVC